MDERLFSNHVKPVQMLRASHQVAKQIEEMILNGSLKPGDRLPGERTLADQFQTSRNPIREAVRALEALGYIEVKPGKGTYVAQMHDTNTVEILLGQKFQSRREKLLESVTFHRALFIEAAYLAALNHTDEQLTAARTALEEQEAALANRDKMGLLYADWVFTSTVGDMSGSCMLSRMVPESMDYVKDTRATLFALPGSEHAAQSIAEHKMILAAIADGNATAAADQARQHIVSTMSRWSKLQGEKAHAG